MHHSNSPAMSLFPINSLHGSLYEIYFLIVENLFLVDGIFDKDKFKRCRFLPQNFYYTKNVIEHFDRVFNVYINKQPHL